MAGIISESGITGQLRLIAALRWRMFVNSLRIRGGKADFAGRLISGGMIGFGTFGAGIMLGLGAWAALHESEPLLLAGELWFVFTVWQLLPIFVTGFGAQADLGILLRFPLSYPAFVLLTLGYGLLDPVGLAALYWLAMILGGIGIAVPEALPWAAQGLGAFAAVNLLLSRAVFAWLDRWLAQRRTREILGVVFFLLMMSVQFIQPLAERWGKKASSAMRVLAPAEAVLPPGMAAAVVEGVQPGRRVNALASLGGFAMLGFALAGLLGIRLRAQYRGESLSETPRQKSKAARLPAHEGWKLTGLSAPVEALLEKDLRYLVRNTGQYLNLSIPLILVFLFGLQGRESGALRTMPFLRSGLFFPGALAYCFMVVIAPAYRALGYEGPGIAMLLAAPIRFRDVFVAKNLLYSLIFGFEAAAIFAAGLLLGVRPDLSIVAITLAAVLFALPLNFAVGNVVSLYSPSRMQFGAMRRQKLSGMATLIGLVTEGATIGLCAGIFILARFLGKGWIGCALFLPLAVLAFVFYRWTLAACSGIAESRRESLMKVLGG